ncbi:MAG: UPF0182 family protein [Corynebacterium sp.]|nr:UPF0182 family protein [Corynebacterium sp.]
MPQPPSVPRPQLSSRQRRWAWIIGITVIVLALIPMAVGIYTDWLWFGEVEYRQVFNTILVSRIVLFLVFGLLGAALTWLASWLTYKGRPDELETFTLDGPIPDYRASIEKLMRWLLVGFPVFIGLLTGFIGQQNWQVVQLFFNRQDFGMADPQFGLDYGFYAFALPGWNFLLSIFSLLIVIAFFVALIGHYLLGSIRMGDRANGTKAHISPYARNQLGITAGIWMLLQVASYWLERYELLTREHETFMGGSFTDINAVLPARIILMVIALITAISFFAVIFLKDLRIPALSTALMLVSAVIIGGAWPLLMERFSVEPNRAERESEYIARNIEATRYAYGITDEQVNYVTDWGSGGSSEEAIANDVATVSNIRLLDPEVLSPTFTQQQQLRNFYGFPDSLNIDRYEVDGELRDFVVAARELNPNSLRENQQDWINRHTVYTHGNGIVAAPANQVDEVARDVGSSRGGYPVYSVSDLQGTSSEAEEIGLGLEQARSYFGPVIASAADGADYAVVGSADGSAVEYDTDNSSYTYTGSGGVDIGNFFNRAAYAIQYQELNLVLSERVNENSKIIYNRDPRERVHDVAPWLTTDSKTYPTVIDGRIKWIVDGYTTVDSLPYTQRTSLSQATADSSSQNDTGNIEDRLFNDSVGYMRNSVKAVVDAYDGSVKLYQFDEDDPVLKAWMGVFPDSVLPKSDISDELNEHLRYPEDMFKVQRAMLAHYHVDDARDFFTNDRFWSVPTDPSEEETTPVTDSTTVAAGTMNNDVAQPPYYVVAADPDTGKSSFQLITPFRGLQREYLAAHMAVSSDPETYGKITVRVLPTESLTLGPKQAQDTMMSSDQIASDRTLWRDTNDLTNGNLLTLPVGDGEILYVEPLYSQRKDQESAFPKLLRVLVFYNGQVGYAPTISEALSQVGIDPKAAQDLDEAVDLDEGPVATIDDADADAKSEAESSTESTTKTSSAEATTTTSTTTSSAPASGDEQAAMQRIADALDGLEDARGGTNEEYGRALDELDAAVAEYQQLTGTN